MKPILLLIGTVTINIIGQVAMKQGMTQVGAVTSDLSQLPAYIQRTITTPFVLIGFGAYALSSVLWLAVLSLLDISVAYPVLSIGYVGVVLISALFLQENVSLIRWLGVLVICFGVYLISRS